MTKKLGQKDRNRLINLILLLVGYSIGIFLDVLVHELGHYSFAYFFNKSAIKGLYYSPIHILKATLSLLRNPTNIVTLAHVDYYGSVFELFSEYQALLVCLGGLIFELAFFGLLLMILYKLANRYKKEKNKTNLYLCSLLCGIILSMVLMVGSWVLDGMILLLHFTVNRYLIAITVALSSVVIFRIWLYCVNIYVWRWYFKDLFEREELTMLDFIKNSLTKK